MKKFIVIERCSDCPCANIPEKDDVSGSCNLTYSKIYDKYELNEDCPLDNLPEGILK